MSIEARYKRIRTICQQILLDLQLSFAQAIRESGVAVRAAEIYVRATIYQ